MLRPFLWPSPLTFFLIGIAFKGPLLLHGLLHGLAPLVGMAGPEWFSLYKMLPFGWGNDPYSYAKALVGLAVAAKVYKPIMLAQMFFFPQMKESKIFKDAKNAAKWVGKVFVLQPLHFGRDITIGIGNSIRRTLSPIAQAVSNSHIIRNVVRPTIKTAKEAILSSIKNILPAKNDRMPFAERVFRSLGYVPAHEKAETQKVNVQARALLHTLAVYGPASVLPLASMQAGLLAYSGTTAGVAALSTATWAGWLGVGLGLTTGVGLGAAAFIGGWYAINKISKFMFQQAAGNVTYPTQNLPVANANAVVDGVAASVAGTVIHKLHHGLSEGLAKLGISGVEASTAGVVDAIANVAHPGIILLSAAVGYKKYKAEYERLNQAIDREVEAAKAEPRKIGIKPRGSYVLPPQNRRARAMPSRPTRVIQGKVLRDEATRG